LKSRESDSELHSRAKLGHNEKNKQPMAGKSSPAHLVISAGAPQLTCWLIVFVAGFGL
jgi:hypothetical protein